jgi:hypothetical protein
MIQTFTTTSPADPHAYVVVFTADRASVLAGSALQVFNGANWQTYAIAYVADPNVPGLWVATLFAGVPDGNYLAVTYRQAGGSPATTDEPRDEASFTLVNGAATAPPNAWDQPDSYLLIAGIEITLGKTS